MERMRTNVFILLIAALATASALLLWSVAPSSAALDVATIATLGGLALTAECMSFLLPHNAYASISFIPYVTSILLLPNTSALIAVGGAQVIAELVRRGGIKRIVFNCAQLVVTYSMAILVFRGLGGQSLFALRDASAVATTRAVGAQITAAYIVVFGLNTLLVSQIIAVAKKRRTLEVWRENMSSTIGIDILALPLIFAFAWVYAHFGAMFASLIWLPILGLRQLNTTNIELAQTNRELLELMIKSIEARDPYTSGHSRRVREYAIQIARLAGLSVGEVEKVGTAALLHDVGKIYDKYAPILAKEDRLTPEEWAIIKEHPADGANLVATMTTLRHLVPAVRHHHENWDGTGYPDGLKGEDIPLASRVIMFADTLDAMTTKRPYRGPLGEEAVRSELVRCRGKQFDPDLTDKLLKADFWSSLFPPANRNVQKGGILRLMAAGSRD
jgi:putative nucleotidyltransferase with HDIG domain